MRRWTQSPSCSTSRSKGAGWPATAPPAGCRATARPLRDDIRDRFIAVDERGRSAPRTWRTLLSVEQPELFVGFGRPILAPAARSVVVAHDGEAAITTLAGRNWRWCRTHCASRRGSAPAVRRSPATTW